MRDRLTITISDINSTKSYNFHQSVKKILGYGLAIVTILLFGGSYYIWYLSNTIGELESKKETLSSDYEKMENKAEELSKTIMAKNQEFEAIRGRVDDIEDLIGLKFDENMNTKEKLNLATLNVVSKSITLDEIPNGYPVEFNGINADYGWREHPILKRREFHPGLDLKAQIQTPIYATANGVVEYARFHKTSGYGKLIIISHNYGFTTMYAHLDDIKVEVGDIIKKGDLIGYSGNTGLSSGPHLHYEIKYLNMPLDPINFVKWSMQNYDELFDKENKVKWQSLVNLINNSNKVQLLSQKGQK